MLYQRKWLGQSTFWIGKNKFDTKEEALDSINIDLVGTTLYAPWCSIDLADREIGTINDGINEIVKILRSEIHKCKTDMWMPRGVTTDGESFMLENHHSRFDSLKDLAHNVGLRLCGKYLCCGYLRVKLHTVDCATFTEGWFMLQKNKEDRRDQDLMTGQVISSYLYGLSHGGGNGP